METVSINESTLKWWWCPNCGKRNDEWNITNSLDGEIIICSFCKITVIGEVV